MPVDERSMNAFLPSPDTVLADASDIFRPAAPDTKSRGGRRCGQVVQHAGYVVRSLGKELWKEPTRRSSEAR